MTVSRRSALLVVAPLLACGCAINEYGFVRVREYDSATGRLVELDAWGAHVLVGVPDAGLTLGHSNRTYAFPVDGEPGKTTDFEPSAISDARAYAVGDARPGSLLDRTPVAMISRTQGVSLDVGTARVGFSAGVGSRAVIVLPAVGTTTLFFSYDRSNPDHSRLFIKEDQ